MKSNFMMVSVAVAATDEQRVAILCFVDGITAESVSQPYRSYDLQLN